MSELKEHLFCECDECIREYRGPLSNEMRPYYLKSEADKVIAHQKFMRCNLLIDYCGLKQNICEEEKVPFWRKWYLRWCELSDKFKEAKR